MCSFSVCVPPGPIFLPSLSVCVCVCVYSGQGRRPLCCYIKPLSRVHLPRHVCASTRVSWLCIAGLSSCVCLCVCICFVRVCVMTSSCQNRTSGRKEQKRHKTICGKDSCGRVCFSDDGVLLLFLIIIRFSCLDWPDRSFRRPIMRTRRANGTELTLHWNRSIFSTMDAWKRGRVQGQVGSTYPLGGRGGWLGSSGVERCVVILPVPRKNSATMPQLRDGGDGCCWMTD